MKLLPPTRKGNLVEKGVALAMFFFILVLLPTIFMIVNQNMRDDITAQYGNSSPAYVASSYGINGSLRFMSQVPTAATVGGITIVILIIGFAIGDYLTKKNQDGGGQQPPTYTGGGFGG